MSSLPSSTTSLDTPTPTPTPTPTATATATANASPELPDNDQVDQPTARTAAFSAVLWPSGLAAERTDVEIAQAHRALRHLILTDPYDEEEAAQLRSTTWKILLGALHCPADYYFDLVSRPQSNFYGKIRNDTFRTLATDSTFKKRVHENMLVRLLEGFVWRSHGPLRPAPDTRADKLSSSCADDYVSILDWPAADLAENPPDQRDSPYDFTYVQGMNVLAAPFLYTMPSELEAFYAFTRFIEFHCPLYVQPTLEGVHRGLKLLDECLQIVDRELFNYLRSKNLAAELYAFPSVLTFCACTEPLDQVLQLWDYLLAFGVGLNVLCVISQLYMMRDRVLAHPSPMAILRKFPTLEARKVIMLTNVFIRELPKELYDRLVRHPFESHATY